MVKNKKHFSPLGTKLYFHVNSSKKKFCCIDHKPHHQHGRLVTRLQAKNSSRKDSHVKGVRMPAESRFKSRLQNSSHFCVFKYTVRTNSLTKAKSGKRGWRETLGFFLPRQTPVRRVRLTRALLARVRLLRCSSLL